MNADPSQLTNAFTQIYGRPPSVVMRAPGRVNLIGEHTDYSLLPVLPFAIDRSVTVAAAKGSGGEVEADSLALPSPLVLRGTVDPAAHEGWHRYATASLATFGEQPAGVQLLIGGDLPFQGGLASSSALTLATLGAVNAVWDLQMGEDLLISSAISAERATGVEGGMMDQTVIVSAAPDTALKISFDPLATRQVPIPRTWSVVVAYSGQPAPKGGQARDAYNRLVVASRSAAALLGRWSDVYPGAPPTLSTVASVPEAMSMVGRLPERATAETVAREAAVRASSLVSLTTDEFDAAGPLPVRAAGTHALSEAARVDAAEVALETQDLDRLGQLLDESQASLVSLGVSTPQLDQLVVSMRDAGAMGSRLTGAGFGGFALALCAPDKESEVVAAGASVAGGPAFAVRPSGGLSRL